MNAALNIVFLVAAAVVVIGFAYLAAPRLVPPQRGAFGFALVAGAAFLVGLIVAPRSAPNIDGASSQAVEAPPTPTDVSAACLVLRGTAVSRAGVGSLDSITLASSAAQLPAGTPVSPSDVLIFSGWAISSSKTFLARAVCVEIDGRIQASLSADYGVARPDVASSLTTPAFVASGFQVKLTAAALGKGAHSIAIAVIDADGSAGTLGPPRLVGVKI